MLASAMGNLGVQTGRKAVRLDPPSLEVLARLRGGRHAECLAPVNTEELIEIRSRVVTEHDPLYHLEGELVQGDATKVRAFGRFLKRREGEP